VEHIDPNKHHVALVHGVTGSGKTLVYIDLIKKCINEDKSVAVRENYRIEIKKEMQNENN